MSVFTEAEIESWIHRSANAVAGFLTRSGYGVRMLARE
jgi:hypothetical protein